MILRRECPLELSNGHKVDFACASGALAFDGRGWVWEWPFRWLKSLRPQDMTIVAKTVTMNPRKGNLRWTHPWTCVRLLPGSNAVNAIGLTNPGIKHWAKKCYPVALKKGYKIAASVMPSNEEEAYEMGRILQPLDLAYVEINISCPNLKDNHPDFSDIANMLTGLGKKSEHPLVVKLSFDQAMCDPLLETLSKHEHVEAVHAINTVPWDRIYKDATSPLKSHTGTDGGVSGPVIFDDYTCVAVEKIRKQCSDLGIIGGGGIGNWRDCVMLNSLGAQAFSIGTLFIRSPWKPNKLMEEFRGRNETQASNDNRS